MATYKGLAKDREELADKADKKLSKLILQAQVALTLMITYELSKRATKLTIAQANRIVDEIFDAWAREHGAKIAQHISENIIRIHSLNTTYYGSFLPGKKVKSAAADTWVGILQKYGITANGKPKPAGYIYSSVADPSIARRLKSVLTADVQSKAKPSRLISNMRNILGRVGVGLVETKLAESFPSGLLQVDREVNGVMATELQLDHAIYQGGLIKTSRPFCEERNNKVFTREEILKFGTSADKFGGYTNKSAGEFQGKTKSYNPITDLGGYNCRHFYSWISEDLAFILRPDLKK